MFKRQTIKKTFLAIYAIALGLSATFLSNQAYAAETLSNAGFSISPMQQKIILNPGDSYSASFNVINPESNINDISYTVNIQPFYVDEKYETIFENVNGLGDLAEWITLDVPNTGILAPGEKTGINYTINVPKTAAAGGQYASLTVASTAVKDDDDDTANSIVIENVIQIGHLVFAEITGDTIRKGEIIETSVPNFLLSGDITGSASIKNTGNVHGTAKYTLQVFPLFSGEEIYTNEEKPETRTILPDRTLYNEITWDNTPAVGIFNVIYTVEFEGVTEQVSKMVIKCPIWLLFIVIFAIAALIIWLILRARTRKSPKNKSKDEE